MKKLKEWIAKTEPEYIEKPGRHTFKLCVHCTWPIWFSTHPKEPTEFLLDGSVGECETCQMFKIKHGDLWYYIMRLINLRKDFEQMED